MRLVSACAGLLALVSALLCPAQMRVVSTTSLGSDNSMLTGMAVDAAGNRYISIYLANIKAPPGPLILPGDPGFGSVIVQKIGLEGAIQYTAWLAGLGAINALPRIAVNRAGEVLLAGKIRSSSIRATSGALDQGRLNSGVCVVKLNASGDRAAIVATLDVEFGDLVSLALDASDNVYLGVGGSLLLATNLAIKLNPALSQILLTAPLADSGDNLSDLTVNSEGSIFATGISPAQEGEVVLHGRASMDGGLTWRLASSIRAAQTANQRGSVVFHPKHPSILFDVGRGGIYRSTDSGATWERFGTGLESSAVWGIFIHPQRPDLMFANVTPITYQDRAPTIFRSQDGGATWSAVSSDPVILRVVFDPSDSNTVFLDNPLRLIRSLDGGLTFQYVSDVLQSPNGTRIGENVFNLSVDPANAGRVYGYTPFGLARSDDSGSSWRTLYFACGACPRGPVSFDPSDDSTLYASGEISAVAPGGFLAGIARSRDGGATWTLTSGQVGFSMLAHSATDPTLFFANIGGRLMRTADGGVTWTKVSGLGERSLPTALEIAPSDASMVYATYERRGDIFVSKLDPGGNAVFSGRTGGFGDKTGIRIRTDSAGRIYIAGVTNSLEFPADTPMDGDDSDAFVVAFDPASAPAPVYAHRMTGVTFPGDLTVNCSGNVTLAFRSNTAGLATTPDAFQPQNAGGADIVLAQFGPDGRQAFLSYFGGPKDDSPNFLSMDPDGRLHMAGSSNSSTLPGLPQGVPAGPLFTTVLETALGACQ